MRKFCPHNLKDINLSLLWDYFQNVFIHQIILFYFNMALKHCHPYAVLLLDWISQCARLGLLLQGLKCHTKTFSGKNIFHTPPAMTLQGCLTYMSLTLTLPVMTVMTMSSSSGGYTTSQCWQNDDSVSNLTQRGCEQNGPYPTHRPRVSSLCGNDVIKWHDIPFRRRHEWKKRAARSASTLAISVPQISWVNGGK